MDDHFSLDYGEMIGGLRSPGSKLQGHNWTVVTIRTRNRLKEGLKYALLSFIGYPIYVALTRNVEWLDVGTILILLLIAIPMLLSVKYRVYPVLRRAPFALAILGMTLCLCLAIGFSYVAAVWASSALDVRAGPISPETIARSLDRLSTSKNNHVVVGLSILGATLATGTLATLVGRKLGKGVLVNWITGRYHHPRLEKRAFMMIDLKGSTTLAEKLGNLAFSSFVSEFFHDVSDAVEETEGEVSHYVGDEVVISWPPRAAFRNDNCLRCFAEVSNSIASRSGFYLAKFGFVPEFRAGLHWGEVVVTEVGDMKSEIVFHGDVLNTTARIQGQCKELGVSLLFSNEVANQLSTGVRAVMSSRGDFQLKGKELKVSLFCLVDPDREETS